MMLRQFVVRGLVVGALVSSISGCESLHSMVRHDDKDSVARQDEKDDETKPKSVDLDTSKLNGVSSDDSGAKPFFKNNRLSGGWSSEAREIEKNLGVY